LEKYSISLAENVTLEKFASAKVAPEKVALPEIVYMHLTFLMRRIRLSIYGHRIANLGINGNEMHL
jgi:hypothetical protein